MKGCDLAYNPGEGPKVSLYQPKLKLLDEEDIKRYQPIMGTVMYHRQVSLYYTRFDVNQLARVLFIATAKNLHRYLTGSVTSPLPASEEGSSSDPTLKLPGAITPTMTNQRFCISLCLPMDLLAPT